MKIFTLSNQNQHIDYPKPSHHLRKIHILSNWKLSNYPVGVHPSSRRPHPKNAKLFLSIYRLCQASAGFIRPHPSLISASSGLTHSIFPLPELDSSGPSTGPLGPTPFLPFFLILTQPSDTDSFEELKLCPYLRMFFLYFQGFSCSFRFLFRFFKGLMREFQRNFPLSFSGFLKGREQEGKRKNEDRWVQQSKEANRYKGGSETETEAAEEPAASVKTAQFCRSWTAPILGWTARGFLSGCEHPLFKYNTIRQFVHNLVTI